MNNCGDVCVRLDLKPIRNSHYKTDEIVYIFEHHEFVAAGKDLADMPVDTNMSLTDDDDDCVHSDHLSTRWIYASSYPDEEGEARLPWTGVSINSEYLLLWNKTHIAFVELDSIADLNFACSDDISVQELDTTRLQEQGDDYEIVNIRTGSDAAKIAIIARYRESRYVFFWNLAGTDDNKELACHRVHEPFTIFFDSEGDGYVVMADKVIMSTQRTSTTAFDLDADLIQALHDNFDDFD